MKKENEERKYRWFTSLFDGEQTYEANGVQYIVGSKFKPFPEDDLQTMRDRMEKVLRSDFTDLTEYEEPDILETEDVYPAVRKEKKCSRDER